jgi:hypothetical protein
MQYRQEPDRNLKGNLNFVISILDEKRKVLKKRRGHSFVVQFLQLVYAFFMHANTGSTTSTISATTHDTSGSLFSMGNTNNTPNPNVGSWGAVLGPVNDDTYGIVLGTGVTPVTDTDYVMETQIAHGTGSGQLSHGATSATPAGDAGGQATLQVERTFQNNSGADIIVKEIGIYVKQVNSSGSYNYVLIARDNYEVTIPNASVRTVVFTFITSP